MTQNEVSEDRLLDGRVRLVQPVRGFRAGADTVLLAAAVAPGARVLEAGCGAGGALLCAAARLTGTRFVGVERDPEAAALASRNVAANGAAAQIVVGDILDRGLDLGAPFDGAFCNPPFQAPGAGRPPAPEKAAAYVMDAPLSAWIAALADRLTGGAPLTLIHRADALPEILAGLTGRLGGAEAIPIQPRAEAPAHRVLVRAFKGSRGPFALLPALILHEGEAFTPRAEAIFRHGSPIPWR